MRRRSDRTLLWATGALIVVGLVLASQRTFYGDEGLDLLSGALINAGRRPYVDFFYQHQPLYSYLIAGWMILFGQSWRAVHVLSALLTAGAAVLVMRFVLARVGERSSGAWTAAAAGLLFAGNVLVVHYALMGQAYGLTLLLTVAALSVAARPVTRPRDSWWTGLYSAGAVNASLLVLPVWPILACWTLWRAPRGERGRHAGWLIGGSIAASLPAAFVAARGLRQFLFDVFEYQFRYRWTHDSRAFILLHDLGTLAGWLKSAQAGMLLLLALAGFVFLGSPSQWRERTRSELRLCAWLCVGLAAYLACCHPTFEQYFVFVVPFAAILASIGLYGLVTQLGGLRWPALGFAAVIALMLLPAARWTYSNLWPRYAQWWPRIEATAAVVDRVTPVTGRVRADPFICFVARRLPPSGLENPFALEVSSAVPPELGQAIHVETRSGLDERLGEGRFATVLLGASDPRSNTLFPSVYRQRQLVVGTMGGPCYLLWAPVAGAPARPPAAPSQ